MCLYMHTNEKCIEPQRTSVVRVQIYRWLIFRIIMNFWLIWKHFVNTFWNSFAALIIEFDLIRNWRFIVELFVSHQFKLNEFWMMMHPNMYVPFMHINEESIEPHLQRTSSSSSLSNLFIYFLCFSQYVTLYHLYFLVFYLLFIHRIFFFPFFTVPRIIWFGKFLLQSSCFH